MKSECSLKTAGPKTYYCDVELTLQIIGGKWKPIILFHLGEEGTLRFSEIRRIIPNISPKMLTQKLRELESDGVVHREVYPQVPPKVEYCLTDLGRSVMPIIRQLSGWGKQYEGWLRKKNRAE